MAFDINEHYDFDTFYTREKELTYSNRYTNMEKWGAILVSVCYLGIVAFFIGVAIYVVFWESLIWPVFIIGLGALLPVSIAAVVISNFRKILNHQVFIELHQKGFTQTIKNRKTQEIQELHLPFNRMESVTMGRFLYVVSAKKHSPGTYWLSIELAIKGLTQDGKMVVKRFPLKNPDEIQLWIEHFQQNKIPIYYTDTLIKDLTLEGYDKIVKVKYPEETGELALAYKTVDQNAPLNWDGKQIYH
jgi:hypothetical protein